MSADEAKDSQPEERPSAEAPAPHGVASFWPVVAFPAAVITVAAVAGYVAGEIATLVLGILAVSALIGLVAYGIVGRKRRWTVAVWVTVVAVALLVLGLLKVTGSQPTPASPAASSPTTPSSPVAIPVQVNAGRQFNQQKVNETRHFRGADLRGAQFVNLDLRGIDFSGAKAAGASFYGSRLDRADLRGADLGGAILIGTCLLQATLHGADLTGAIATGADVTGVDLTPAETVVAIEWPQPGTATTACI